MDCEFKDQFRENHHFDNIEFSNSQTWTVSPFIGIPHRYCRFGSTIHHHNKVTIAIK